MTNLQLRGIASEGGVWLLLLLECEWDIRSLPQKAFSRVKVDLFKLHIQQVTVGNPQQ